MSYKVEQVTKPLMLGEGPHWDIATQTLYFVDIVGCSVHSYKPSTNEHHSAIIGDGKLPVSIIIPVEGQKGKFLITVKNQLAVISWDGKSSTISAPQVISSAEPQDNGNRINDGKCDPRGRVWAGTMLLKGEGPDKSRFDPVGTLYSIDKNVVKKHFGNIHIANGLAWSLDNKTFYYIDSLKFRVDAYDYDIETGAISNERTAFDFKENNVPGFPDGMTIDSEGILYIANFNGDQVIRVNPKTGKIVSLIKLPTKQITSVAIGGANLDELYVTSANIDQNTHQPLKHENGSAGCLFKVTGLGVKGLPMTNVKL